MGTGASTQADKTHRTKTSSSTLQPKAGELYLRRQSSQASTSQNANIIASSNHSQNERSSTDLKLHDNVSHASSGQMFIGDYKLNLYPPIGSGSFGQVVKAKHQITNAEVAVKIITYNYDGVNYEELKRLALEEKDKMFSVEKHENIVAMIDHHVDSNSVFLIMELCNAGDLGKYLSRNQNLNDKGKLDILSQISTALVVLHNNKPPIVHRDIKPGNVLILIEGGKTYAKVCDFGFARLLDEGASFVNTKSAKGTTLFMAPEMFAKEGELSYSTSADVFSFGILVNVVWQFGPTNQSPLPTSAFGKEMKEASNMARALPVLVEITDDDTSSTQELKRLILKMTMLDPKRICMKEVQRTLMMILQQLPLHSMLGQGSLSLKVTKEILYRKSITIINGHIWLCNVDGIDVYSPDLELLQQIRHDTLDKCWSAALLPDGDVVAAGYHGAAVVSTKGTVRTTISTEWYSAVRVHGDKAYMMTGFEGDIHVYECEQWVKVHDIAIPCTCGEIGSWHTLVITDRHIIVACGWTDTIYLLSHSCDLHSTIGPAIKIMQESSSGIDSDAESSTSSNGRVDTTTESRLSRPRLCERVDGDAVLVADRWNERLLVLSAAGEWRRVHLQGEVWWPWDATWGNGMLYVMHGINEKLSIFA